MAENFIKIDEKIFAKLKEKIKDTEFKSAQDYINYLLEKIVLEEEENFSGESYSEEEENQLKEDLKDLGYI